VIGLDDPTVVLQTCIHGAHIMFDASGSYDPDQNELYYTWSFPWRSDSHRIAREREVPVGQHTVELTVSDWEFEDTASVVVEVIATDPDTWTNPCQ